MAFVVEKFVSINGEGAHAGEIAAFIRFKGCNLNCSYCDTRWANVNDVPFEEEEPEELAEWVRQTGSNNVTLTGGEPLMQKDIMTVIEKLTGSGHRVEIETNGSINLEKFAAMKQRPCFTMDYKLPSSGMEKAMDMSNFSLLNEHDTVKFVSGSIEDLDTAKRIIDKYSLTDRCHVYISPVFGSIEPSRIVSYMISHKMNGVRLQLQLHKFIWAPDKRGV